MGYEGIADIPKLAKEVTDTSRVLSLAGGLQDAGPPLSAGVPAVLVSITVARGATFLAGPNGWATIKDATRDVIIVAKTQPNTMAAWKQITWFGDTSSAVPGMPNQRSLSRATSRDYNVGAKLGGMNDTLSVWVLWANISILMKDSTPTNSAKFEGDKDGTEKLGAIAYKSLYSDRDEATGKFTDLYAAAGKVAPVANITPFGIHTSIKTGWTFKRERMGRDWKDGVKVKPGENRGNLWNTKWVDDTSSKNYRKETPDSDDKIYDLDGPDIGPRTIQKNDYETYNNFRQWIEWNGQRCSDYALWYWKAEWQRTKPRNITLNELGTGNIKLPDKSPLHP